MSLSEKEKYLLELRAFCPHHTMCASMEICRQNKYLEGYISYDTKQKRKT